MREALLQVGANGRLIAHGDSESLSRALEGRVWEWTVPAAWLDELRRRHQVSSAIRRGDQVQMRLIADGTPGEGARPALPTLEEVYLHAVAAGRTATVAS